MRDSFTPSHSVILMKTVVVSAHTSWYSSQQRNKVDIFIAAGQEQ